MDIDKGVNNRLPNNSHPDNPAFFNQTIDNIDDEIRVCNTILLPVE